MTLAAVQSLVDDLVRDTDQVIGSSARADAIALAVVRYSADAPRRVVEDVVVDVDGNLPLPTAWLEGESELREMEWPIGQKPRSIVSPSLLEVIVTPTGTVLALQGDIPTGSAVRITYSGAHVLDATQDTIPLRHRAAVASLAASTLCGQLAAHYANEGAPTIGADIVDHQGKTERWRARARDLLAQYTQIVGPAPAARNKSASVDVAVERPDSLGRQRIFHPARNWSRG